MHVHLCWKQEHLWPRTCFCTGCSQSYGSEASAKDTHPACHRPIPPLAALLLQFHTDDCMLTKDQNHIWFFSTKEIAKTEKLSKNITDKITNNATLAVSVQKQFFSIPLVLPDAAAISFPRENILQMYHLTPNTVGGEVLVAGLQMCRLPLLFFSSWGVTHKTGTAILPAPWPHRRQLSIQPWMKPVSTGSPGDCTVCSRRHYWPSVSCGKSSSLLTGGMSPTLWNRLHT